MTDMRATERLLEVIFEEVKAVEDGMAGRNLRHGFTPELAVISALSAIVFAVTELRRRGDTLVRRDDLRRVLENDTGHNGGDEPERYNQAYDRLEIALGGKPR